ncbi:hypothetical protein [Fibrella aquatica]|jgi:hypothetical protein|uniref:hypothetical protein n=1 Tax=Fibrella aquatica TaxID=3242487 RepID=UPI0035211C0A
MIHWLLNVLIGIKVGLCSCTPEVRRLGKHQEQPLRLRSQYRVERIGRLPLVVNESSGLARRTATTVWTHNDGGGRATLYGVEPAGPGKLGTLLDSIALPQLRNIDWEDLAQQDSTRLFIADLGNNGNARRDLMIHEVGLPQKTVSTYTISYADQTAFPPKKRNFDCEAVFYRSDSLFLLSKNRSGHIVRLYGLPARPGTHTLMPLDSVFIKSMVTGAAVSPNGNKLAVITYGKVLFFDLSNRNSIRLNRFAGCLRLPRGQSEAITFMTDNELIITNERGRVYRVIPR